MANSTNNLQLDKSIQDIFNQLLKSGMSYVQISVKYDMCKRLFPKGTPEFYACMGLKPPSTPPPTQQQSTNSTATSINQTIQEFPVHSQKPSYVQTLVETAKEDKTKLILLGGLVALLVVLLINKRK